MQNLSSKGHIWFYFDFHHCQWLYPNGERRDLINLLSLINYTQYWVTTPLHYTTTTYSLDICFPCDNINKLSYLCPIRNLSPYTILSIQASQKPQTPFHQESLPPNFPSISAIQQLNPFFLLYHPTPFQAAKHPKHPSTRNHNHLTSLPYISTF